MWSRRFLFEQNQFVVRRGVFDPVRHLSGVAFAEQLDDGIAALAPDARTAVDLGTGTGLLAATMARLGLAVVATDIDHAATQCAAQNCDDLDVEVRHGDLFVPLGHEIFDLLVVNPPYERNKSTWRRNPTLTSPDFLERFGARAHDFAPVVLLGFPVDDAEELDATGLDFEAWRTVPTQGRDLGLFVSRG